mgnify:FL=1
MPYLQQARDLALSLDGAWEDFPWEPGHPVYKNDRGKIFLMLSERGEGATSLTLKLAPEESEAALLLPFVSVAAYVGRYGWVTASVTNEVEWEIARPWILRSYELVTRPRRRSR